MEETKLLSLVVLLLLSLASISHANPEPDLSWANDIKAKLEANKEKYATDIEEIRQKIEADLKGAKKCLNLKFMEAASAESRSALIRKLMKGAKPQKQNEKANLLIFVSFSMGKEALEVYKTQAKRYGGQLVLRGLVGGSFKKTAVRLRELGAEIQIDPTAYEKYKITHVPAVVLRDDKSSFDKITGNISVEFALKEFEKKGDLRNLASILLSKLKEAS